MGKVLPVLALSIAMSEAGAAREPAIVALVSTPPPALAASKAETSRSQNSGPSLLVAFQSGSPGTNEVGSRLPGGTEIRPGPPLGLAKNSALVLSSLGMLSLISLLRLNRTL